MALKEILSVLSKISLFFVNYIINTDLDVLIYQVAVQNY